MNFSLGKKLRQLLSRKKLSQAAPASDPQAGGSRQRSSESPESLPCAPALPLAPLKQTPPGPPLASALSDKPMHPPSSQLTRDYYQQELKDLMPLELYDAVYSSESLIGVFFGKRLPISRQVIDKFVTEKWKMGEFPRTLAFPEERYTYQPFVDLLNDIVRLVNPGDKRPPALQFVVWDKAIQDGRGNSKKYLKPNGLCLRCADDLEDMWWRLVVMAVEVKSDLVDAFSQAATYALLMLEQGGLWYAPVIVMNYQTGEIFICIYTRLGAFVTPLYNLSKREEFVKFVQDMSRVVKAQQSSPSLGSSDYVRVTAAGSFFRLPRRTGLSFGYLTDDIVLEWWQVFGYLSRSVSLRGRGTHVYLVKPVDEQDSVATGIVNDNHYSGMVVTGEGLQVRRPARLASKGSQDAEPFTVSGAASSLTNASNGSKGKGKGAEESEEKEKKGERSQMRTWRGLKGKEDGEKDEEDEEDKSCEEEEAREEILQFPAAAVGSIRYTSAVESARLELPNSPSQLSVMIGRGIEGDVKELVLKVSWPHERQDTLESDMFSAVQGQHGIPELVCAFTIPHPLQKLYNLTDIQRCTFLDSKYYPCSASHKVTVERRVQRVLVYKTIGRTIIGLGAIDLAYIVTDAMIGHLNLFLAGYLHRDPSIGNVLMFRDKGPEQRDHDASHDMCMQGTYNQQFAFLGDHLKEMKGFIIDGDLGIEIGKVRPLTKQRSGTLPFLSHRLSIAWGLNESTMHTAPDDMAAFTWVTLWAALHHNLSPTIRESQWIEGLLDAHPTTVANQKAGIILYFQNLKTPSPHTLSDNVVTLLPLLKSWLALASASDQEVEDFLRSKDGLLKSPDPDSNNPEDVRKMFAELKTMSLNYYVKYLQAAVTFLRENGAYNA